jgi:hypothetical protein
MAELLFGFKDLSNIRNPNTPIFNLSSLIIPDSFIRQFNSGRYTFYIKFINGLKNPETLYKFLYTLRDAKIYHADLQEKIAKIAKGLSSISTTDRKKVVDNLKNLIDNNKYDKLFDAVQNFNKKVTGGDTYHIDKPIAPMQSFLNEIHKVAPILVSKPKTTINDVIVSNAVKPDANADPAKGKDISSSGAVDINKLKEVYETFKSVPRISPDRVEIKLLDRGIFIGITLAIRLITLSLIYWCLNSNLINNFRYAFIFYCIVYILFFIFIIALVNVIYYYPIIELFTNISLISIPNFLYYFYIHINGFNRLILHIIIISILMLIPFILSMDKKLAEQPDINISFDYSQKTNIYNSISNFSFVIWVLTSVIALKF